MTQNLLTIVEVRGVLLIIGVRARPPAPPSAAPAIAGLEGSGGALPLRSAW